MSHKKQVYSREFMGVKLVPLTLAQRKAVLVVHDYFTVALLVSGKVAVQSNDVFRDNFERSEWVQNYLAQALCRLGVVTKDAKDKLIQSHKDNRVLRSNRSAAEDMISGAEKLGIDLTKAQQKQISELTKDI